jgi:hypothetical protein
MDARNLIPNRDGEPELEPIAAGKLHREELPSANESDCV